MGGSDDASNIIRLTAFDHIFAHLLLAKAYGGKQWAAINFIFGHYKCRNSLPTKKEIKINALAKEKAAELRRGVPMSEESKLKMSIAGKNKPISWKSLNAAIAKNTGSKQSEETKQKISKAHKGKIRSEEHCLNISKSKKGKKLTDEQKVRLKTQNIGKKHTIETKEKMSLAQTGGKHSHAIKVLCVTTGEIFDCIKDVAIRINKDPSNLRFKFNKNNNEYTYEGLFYKKII